MNVRLICPTLQDLDMIPIKKKNFFSSTKIRLSQKQKKKILTKTIEKQVGNDVIIFSDM